MSFYDKRILKKGEVKSSSDVIYIGNNSFELKDEYIESTLKKKRTELEEDLKKEREARMEELEKEVEEIKRQAYEEGKEKARDEAVEEVRNEMQEKLKQDYEAEMERARSKYLEANHYAIEQEKYINDKKEAWIKENETQIVEILTNSIEKIVGRSMKLESKDIKEILTESLSEVDAKSEKVWVNVSPASKKRLEEAKFEEENVEILADPDLTDLDVLIKTEEEWIDSTVKNKIAKIEKILQDWVEKNEPLR